MNAVMYCLIQNITFLKDISEMLHEVYMKQFGILNHFKKQNYPSRGSFHFWGHFFQLPD